jgi:hypothetical protein
MSLSINLISGESIGADNPNFVFADCTLVTIISFLLIAVVVIAYTFQRMFSEE